MRNVLMGCVCAAMMGSAALAGDANATKVVDKKIALPGGGEIHIRCESGGGGCGTAWGAAGGGNVGGFVGPIIVTARAGDANCPMAGGPGAIPFAGTFAMKAPNPNAAWLGLRVAPVPAAVASQLGLKGKGVMVANIVKDSPAQKAALERYDIIVAVGKDEVRDVGKFIEAIQGCKPGEKIEMTVIRQGKKMEVTATTAKMDLSKVEMVYKDEEDDAWQEELKLHSGMVRRGPGGGWTVAVPGGEAIPLPPDILKLLPKGMMPGAAVKVESGSKGQKFYVCFTDEGVKIEIADSQDGTIQVTRTKIGKDGREGLKTVKQYRNLDDLKAGDEQAYGLYSQMVKGGGIRVQTGGDGEEAGEAGKGVTEGEKIQKIVEKLIEKAKARAAHAAAEAEEAAGAAAKAKREAIVAAAKAKQETEEVRGKIARAIAPEPTAEFNVDADGRVTVSVRDGDTAAKLTFKSEEEMMVKAPKLYQRYRALLGKMMK